MCTLTWVHAAATEPASGARAGGYRLWFNRDERKTRGPEVPPAQAERAGLRYLAPADSDAGGTWLCVNELGVTVALLNGYVESRGPTPAEWTSRGHLVRELADLEGTNDLWQRLSPRGLAPYKPCVVVVVAPDAPAVVARWDGLDLVVDPMGERQLPLVSSSYEQDEVQRRRRALYDEVVGGGGGSPERLDAFQRWVAPEGPDAFSPSMQREDASTRSQCRVEVDGREARLAYVPGPPHATAAREPLRLARRAPAGRTR